MVQALDGLVDAMEMPSNALSCVRNSLVRDTSQLLCAPRRSTRKESASSIARSPPSGRAA